ncbi:hypothetical protein ACFFRR_009637 [Megaselia abdita]
MTDFVTLLNEQKALGDQLNSLLSNFRKANQDRWRNPDYLNNSHNQIRDSFARFKKNNESLLGLDDQTCEYFTEEYYSKVANAHDRVWPVIIEIMKEQGFVSEAGTTHQSDVLRRLVRKQMFEFEEASALCERVAAQCDEQNVELTSEDYTFYLNKLEQTSVELRTLQRSIAELVNFVDSHASGYSKAECEEKAKSVTYWIDFLVLKRNQLRVRLPTPKQEAFQAFQMKTPNIEVPSFDGTLSKWPQFRDLFVDCIHSKNQYPESFKFQFFDGTLSKWPQFRDLFVDCIHSKNQYPESFKFQFLKSKLVNEFKSRQLPSGVGSNCPKI